MTEKHQEKAGNVRKSPCQARHQLRGTLGGPAKQLDNRENPGMWSLLPLSGEYGSMSTNPREDPSPCTGMASTLAGGGRTRQGRVDGAERCPLGAQQHLRQK